MKNGKCVPRSFRIILNVVVRNQKPNPENIERNPNDNNIRYVEEEGIPPM